MELNLRDVKNEFNQVKASLKTLTKNIDYDFDNVERCEDLDQVFLYDQYHSLRVKAEKILEDLEYLDGRVIEQGLIRHNESGRYELPSGKYFTSGSTCEILHNHPFTEEQYWVITSIEHSGHDYYATALGVNTCIDGMMVRVRANK